MSQVGDLVVDEGVTFVVTFDGRQSLLGMRRSMESLIETAAHAREVPVRKTARHVVRRRPKLLLWRRS